MTKNLTTWLRERRDTNRSEQPRTQWSTEDVDQPYVELNDDGTLTVHTNHGSQENWAQHVSISLPQDLVRQIAREALALDEDQDETFPDNLTPWVLGPWTDEKDA